MKQICISAVTDLYLLLNTRSHTGSIADDDYIVDISTLIPFRRGGCRMPPLPINNELVVIPAGHEHNTI